jgi:hypothetical protein
VVAGLFAPANFAMTPAAIERATTEGQRDRIATPLQLFWPCLIDS